MEITRRKANNIVNYVRSYAKSTELPFNEIDSLVLSRVSYIPFHNIVSSHVTHKITVLGAFKDFLNRYRDPYKKVLWHDDVPLMAAMAESQRFKKMELCAYKNILDPHREMQFAAITIFMGNGQIFISFRGTDDTFLGWKEDLNMSFLPVIPSQQEGVRYFNYVCENTKGDIITDLVEDMAAEQKARSTYDNILRLCKDYPDVYEPIKFLRAREIVHFQRFGEALRITQDKLNEKNFYAFNPSFDTTAPCLNDMKCQQ